MIFIITFNVSKETVQSELTLTKGPHVGPNSSERVNTLNIKPKSARLGL